MVRVVNIIEAQSLSGIAKPFLEFAKWARSPAPGFPALDLSVLTYHRDPKPGGPRPGDSMGEPSSNPFITAAERAGIPVDIIHEQGRFDRRILAQIAEAIQRRSPHLVQTHNVKSHFLMRYSGLWRKQPWIAFQHGYVSSDPKMRLYNQLDRWSLRAAAHVITVCEPFRRQLIERGIAAERITVRHNAIQPSAPVDQDAVRAVRDTLPDTPILLLVGRLSHEKGLTDTVETLAILQTRGVDAHVVMVGEGPERAAIEQAVARLKLERRVTLTGQRDDVRPYYALADLFLMPSHSEGSPNALLEAMQAGLPIVAANVGGVPEMVTHERDALLVPARRPPALADAVERLLRDPEEAARLAAGALRETSKFTQDAYGRGLMEVYRRVLGAGEFVETSADA